MVPFRWFIRGLKALGINCGHLLDYFFHNCGLYVVNKSVYGTHGISGFGSRRVENCHSLVKQRENPGGIIFSMETIIIIILGAI